MTRWFYSMPANYNTVSIFETSEYGPTQGYETEKDAILAAIQAAEKRMERESSTILYASKDLSALAHATVKLAQRLKEIK
jgi:hypothetical protein